jgi:hypothetical protein
MTRSDTSANAVSYSDNSFQLQIKIPWSIVPGCDQVRYVSNAMSYVHNSVLLAVQKQYSHMREPLKCVTPLTFMEFTHLFRVISACLVKSEQVEEKIMLTCMWFSNSYFASLNIFWLVTLWITKLHEIIEIQIYKIICQTILPRWKFSLQISAFSSLHSLKSYPRLNWSKVTCPRSQ